MAKTTKRTKKEEKTYTVTESQLNDIVAKAVRQALGIEPDTGKQSDGDDDDNNNNEVVEFPTTYTGKWGSYKVVKGNGKGANRMFVEIEFNSSLSYEKKVKVKGHDFSGYKHSDGRVTWSRTDDKYGNARKMAMKFCGPEVKPVAKKSKKK